MTPFPLPAYPTLGTGMGGQASVMSIGVSFVHHECVYFPVVNQAS
jgi:hypothetical protein